MLEKIPNRLSQGVSWNFKVKYSVSVKAIRNVACLFTRLNGNEADGRSGNGYSRR